MHFTKMQGTGNDYIYVNGFEESVRDAPELARRISDRHFGVGSDGLVLIQPPQTASADFRMEMYNADGSRGRMCGNAIRCVAKYVLDHGLLRNPEAGKDGASQVRVETDAGLKLIRVWSGSDGKATEAEVNMGPPILNRALIPM